MGIILHNCSGLLGRKLQSRVITYFFYFWTHHEKQKMSAFRFIAPIPGTVY